MSIPRVLVVDDDKDNCLLTQQWLTDEGWKTDVACDAPTSLELFQERTHDLIILDYRMADMNGLELFEKMKLLRPHVCVIFYTAYATIDLIDAALAAGAKRVIPKEADSSELLDVVRGIL